MIVEQEQRVVADRLEVPVIGAPFLLPMHRALTGVHVEYDAVGSVQGLGLSDHVAIHGHQPNEVLLAGQQLGLEPMQRRGQRRTPVPPFRGSDQPKRRVGRETSGVIEVFVAGQAAVDRLPQKIGQPELGVQSAAGVAQVPGDDRLKPEAFVKLADQNQTGMEVTRDP